MLVWEAIALNSLTDATSPKRLRNAADVFDACYALKPDDIEGPVFAKGLCNLLMTRIK